MVLVCCALLTYSGVLLRCSLQMQRCADSPAQCHSTNSGKVPLTKPTHVTALVTYVSAIRCVMESFLVNMKVDCLVFMLQRHYPKGSVLQARAVDPSLSSITSQELLNIAPEGSCVQRAGSWEPQGWEPHSFRFVHIKLRPTCPSWRNPGEECLLHLDISAGPMLVAPQAEIAEDYLSSKTKFA